MFLIQKYQRVKDIRDPLIKANEVLYLAEKKLTTLFNSFSRFRRVITKMTTDYFKELQLC